MSKTTTNSNTLAGESPPHTMGAISMSPMHRSHVIEYILIEYVDELSRAGSLYAAEPRQDVIADLLTDLRHYCDKHALDSDSSVRSSALHWTAESIN